MRQLEISFPIDRGCETLRGLRAVDVHWTLDDHGLVLEVATVDGLVARVYLKLSLPVGLHVAGAPSFMRASPSLAAGVPLRVPGDLLRVLIDVAFDAAWNAPQTGEPLPMASESEAGALQRLWARARALAVAIANRCDPSLRRLAMRFLPHLRWRVYERLANDPTGRVAQLAAVAPGVLIFALGLVEHEASAAAGEALLAGVVEGKRLSHLVDVAVAEWAATAPAREIACTIHHPPVWERVVDGRGADREHILAAQRLLVRRAGPRAPTTLVWLPPPVAFAPEDVPRAVMANARWYRVMKASSATLVECGDRGPAQHALSAFASRHAEVLFRRGGCGRGIRRTMLELVDYIAAERRFPSRATNPDRVLADSRRWHAVPERARWWGDHLADDRQLAAHPDVGWLDDRVVVTPLTTVGELRNEGRRMRHCVASWTPRALDGDAHIYHVTIDGRPLTIAVGAVGGRLVVEQFVGVGNRHPIRRESAAIAPWLERVARAVSAAIRCAS